MNRNEKDTVKSKKRTQYFPIHLTHNMWFWPFLMYFQVVIVLLFISLISFIIYVILFIIYIFIFYVFILFILFYLYH